MDKERFWAEQADRMARLEDLRRAESQAYAVMVEVLAAAGTGAAAFEEATGIPSFPEMEVAGTLLLSQSAAEGRLIDAEFLHDQLPAVLDLLRTGELPVTHARILVETLLGKPTEIITAVLAVVIPAATGWDTPVLRRRLRRAVARAESRLQPDQLEQIRRNAIADRRVWLTPQPDGISQLSALLPAEAAAKFQTDLDQLAYQTANTEPADTRRSLDQIRADLLATLPETVLNLTQPDNGNCPSCGQQLPQTDTQPQPGQRRRGRRRPSRTRILITISADTLLGLSTEPGEMLGYGPISPTHTRAILPTADLQRLFIETNTGQPIHLDPTIHPPGTPLTTLLTDLHHPTEIHPATTEHHDPTPDIRRYVAIRDQHCDGPGCSTPPHQADLDHDTPWPEGPTTPDNLKTRSRRCHRAKHHGWQAHTHPNGATTWISPTGRHYVQPPPWPPPDHQQHAA